MTENKIVTIAELDERIFLTVGQLRENHPKNHMEEIFCEKIILTWDKMDIIYSLC